MSDSTDRQGLQVDLEAIEARVNAATKGPWSVEVYEDGEDSEGPHGVHPGSRGEIVEGTGVIAHGTDPDLDREYEVCDPGRKADTIFIAHAKEDVPALVAEVRRLRSQIAGMTSHVTQTGYTRAQLANAVDKAHDYMHDAADELATVRARRGNEETASTEAALLRAHEALHSVGAGLPRVGCAMRDPEANRILGELLRCMDTTMLPCGHHLVDLIGGTEPDTGRPCVTTCGACLALRQEAIAAKLVASDKGRRELEAAISAITVDMPDDQPNGPAERALLDLEEALGGFPWRDQAIDAARTAAAKLCEALADDKRRLRFAAEDYLGGDFSKPAQEPS